VNGSHQNILQGIGSTTLLALRTSTGANVIAALRLAEQLGPDATIVTIMCDAGTKYLNTALFQAHKDSRPAGAD